MKNGQEKSMSSKWFCGLTKQGLATFKNGNAHLVFSRLLERLGWGNGNPITGDAKDATDQAKEMRMKAYYE